MSAAASTELALEGVDDNIIIVEKELMRKEELDWMLQREVRVREGPWGGGGLKIK